MEVPCRITFPRALNGYWDQENVSVTYVAQDEMDMEIANPGTEGWEIVKDPQDPQQQQILKWKDDFSITLNGTAYIYVQLTFPSGAEWEDYSHAFGSRELKNTSCWIKCRMRCSMRSMPMPRCCSRRESAGAARIWRAAGNIR